jgi:uncharacterized protein YjdB
VTATLPGVAAVRERVEVVMRPAAPGRIEILQPVTKLIVGQQVTIAANVFSIHGDLRAEAPTWRSSAPSIVGVNADGRMTAARAGRATLTATAGTATATLDVQVIANTIGRLTLTPAAPSARVGDVIRFDLAALDRGNARSAS